MGKTLFTYAMIEKTEILIGIIIIIIIRSLISVLNPSGCLRVGLVRVFVKVIN